MKFTGALILCFIVTHSSSSIDADGHIAYYGSLIESLYDRYKAAGILISSGTNDYPFENLTLWHEIYQKVSNRGIAMVIVVFQELKERLSVYTKQSRPLLVVLISFMEDIESFADITTNLDLHDALWLILFSGEDNDDVCQFCRNPRGNLLNLRFNSEVAIACCGSRIIEEWWSTGNGQTRVGQLGQWIDGDHGIDWFSSKPLYIRRSSLEGRALRVAIVRGSTDIWKQDDDVHGYLGTVLKELSHSMNFTISTVMVEPSYGRWHKDIKEWSGVIGKIHRKDVDIGVSSFIMTPERIEVADFTVPTVYGSSRLYFKKPGGNNVRWNVYFQAFGKDVWMIIIALILSIPLLLTVIKYRRRFPFFPLISEHYLFVFGIFCQQGLPEFPQEGPLRIVYISIFVSALVVTMAYSASLTSFLAVSSTSLPFTSLEGFLKDGTYRLITIEDTEDQTMFKCSTDPIMNKMLSLMMPEEFLPEDHYEGFRKICRDKLAFHTSFEYREEYMGAVIPCEIVSINTRRIQASAIIMQLHSEYTALVNHHLQRYKNSGLLERWKREQYHPLDNPSGIYHPSVQLRGVAPILGVLSAGVVISLIIFLIERFFHRHKNHFRRGKIRKFTTTLKRVRFHYK